MDNALICGKHRVSFESLPAEGVTSNLGCRSRFERPGIDQRERARTGVAGGELGGGAMVGGEKLVGIS